MSDPTPQHADAAPTDVDAANARADAAEHRALRAEVAAAKKVPTDLLTGTTRDELEAHADRLLDYTQGDAQPRGYSLHLPNADRRPDTIRPDTSEFLEDLFNGGPR